MRLGGGLGRLGLHLHGLSMGLLVGTIGMVSVLWKIHGTIRLEQIWYSSVLAPCSSHNIPCRVQAATCMLHIGNFSFPLLM